MQWQALEVDGPVGTSPVPARLVEDPDHEVLLVRTADGTVHATAMACPHMGQPLSTAELDGDVLECSHHCYRFRVTDGVCVGPGRPPVASLPVHEVREMESGFEVRLGGRGAQRDAGPS